MTNYIIEKSVSSNTFCLLMERQAGGATSLGRDFLSLRKLIKKAISHILTWHQYEGKVFPQRLSNMSRLVERDTVLQIV